LFIALLDDVNFLEMIGKTAREESAEVLTLGEEETLFAALQDGTPDFIFIDLGLASLDGPSLIQKLKQNPSTRKIPIVAFGTSLRADLLQDAKEMGADKVLPKSSFREQLTGLIRHFSGS